MSDHVLCLLYVPGMVTACGLGGETSWSASHGCISWGCCQQPYWQWTASNPRCEVYLLQVRQ
jgi:hypothetical protein